MRLLPYVVVCLIHLAALVLRADAVVDATKLLAMPALCVVLGLPRGRILAATAAAVALSWVGDNVGMVLPEHSAVQLPAMIGAFALAHLAYVVAFGPAFRRRPRWAALLAYVAVATAVVVACWPAAGGLRPLLPLYAAVLAATATTAFSAGRWGRLGGAAFLASDALLALRIFRPGLAAHDAVIMALYFAAQLLLVLAARRLAHPTTNTAAASSNATAVTGVSRI